MEDIVFFDIDGVIADLHSVWYRLYEERTGEKVPSIRGYDIENYVRQPQVLWQVLEETPNIYDEVLPCEGAVEVVKKTRSMGFKVYFATAGTVTAHKSRVEWLKRWGFSNKPEKELIYASDKGTLGGLHLFDDCPTHVMSHHGGVLVLRPFNEEDASRYFLTAVRLEDIPNFLSDKLYYRNPKDRAAVDLGKLSFASLSVPALILEAKAMEYGARKYGALNWRIAGQEVRASTYLSATLRHLFAYWDGEDCDRESGIHHLAHAKASIGVWLDALLTNHCIDDRLPSRTAASLIYEGKDR